ncbi:hypothetical protein [Dyadobacter sp. LHD-138]|uniref:hypothetical protein n=1 Tax=Dyadobacter sp. LHD-138 TaxID=3071413 RepID=UPI0027E09934|nr:hypothetical protein [Dyadobacter sp. LHD-138]MDQ6477811.1 hypothetical protein [Dyadobacter sp. LHD-138]
MPTSEEIYRHFTHMQQAAYRELDEAQKDDKELRNIICGKLMVFDEMAAWFKRKISSLKP